MNLSPAVLLLLLAAPTPLLAIPQQNAQASCTRSATLVACKDPTGSYYSVRTEGSHIYLRGFDSATHRVWAQTNSRYGALTFFTGLASDGEAWVGYSRRVGWTSLTRVSSSNGERFSLRCSLVGGCQ
ncbi:glutamine synthetase [Pseudomonas putida]|uniref:glutamine synthetase n=1 Tax=Pseudomonas putida TaxID=303 RepID=UPI002270B716|nr:glutamine synthetase [Pseudomonas putida]WAB98031.1 glutamine synthetase [Pseudomonas putida]